MPAYQVAVLFYTYNSDSKKTLSTLRSAVLQRGIKHQIVVADDGSRDNHKAEIEQLFAELHFSDYTFSLLDCNMGVTENLRHGAALVDAEYVKILSPGDYLADADVLAKLYAFARENNCKICFGDAAYFQRGENGAVIPMENHPNAPCFVKPYDADNNRTQFRHCLALNDFILGAAVFTETTTYIEYINKIAGHVKYFEDNALRLAIYDGVIIRRFPEIIMWYEYGDGISTNHSDFWIKQCRRDYDETNKLICADTKSTGFRYKRIRFLYSLNIGLFTRRLIVFPEMMIKMFIKKYLPHKSKSASPGEFLRKLLTAEYGADYGKK